MDKLFILQCGQCGVALTRPLPLLHDTRLLCKEDGEPYVPKGYLWCSTGDDYPVGDWVIHLEELINAGFLPNGRHMSGCCGPSGLDGPNRVCANGHEIGTECSDCWMPHAIHLPPTLVRTSEQSND